MDSKPQLNPTYPKGKHLITTECSWWTLPLEHTKALDGKFILKGQFSSPITGNTITVQTPAKLKRGHQKLFNALLHLWHSRNKAIQQELFRELKAILNEPPINGMKKEDIKKLDAIKKEQLTELLGKETLEICKKKTGIQGFEQLAKQTSKFVSVINNDKITLKLTELMTVCDYKDHRKTQRQLIIAQLETLQMTIIKAFDASSGTTFSYPLIAEWSFNEINGDITIRLTSDLMNSTAGLLDGHTTRFCSLDVTNKLKSIHSSDLFEHLQMLGRGRQGNGLYGVVVEVTIEELIRKLNLTNHQRPDKMINKCLKEIEMHTGVTYRYDRIYKTYHLTQDSKILKDAA